MKSNRCIFFPVSVMLSLMVLISCTKEPLVEPNASFSVENIDGLKAGTPVIFNLPGPGDFVTVFTGDPTKEYRYYPQDKGAIVSGSTFSYSYSREGTYTVTAVVSSYGNWAEESARDVAEEVITVTDSRTAITDYFIKSLDITGVIDHDASTISFSMSSMIDRTNLIARFFTESPDAKVYVDDVEQFSDSTANDFTDPVLYEVVAPDGTTQIYATDITLFLPSAEKQLLTFGLNSPEVVAAIIDEETKTATLLAPVGTNLARARVVATSSPLSKVMVQGKTISAERAKSVDLSVNPTIITVIAEDLSEQDYELTTTLAE